MNPDLKISRRGSILAFTLLSGSFLLLVLGAKVNAAYENSFLVRVQIEKMHEELLVLSALKAYRAQQQKSFTLKIEEQTIQVESIENDRIRCTLEGSPPTIWEFPAEIDKPLYK